LPLYQVHIAFSLVYRYCQLEEPASYRKQQLNNSLKLHEFFHDVEDELSWIKDRRPIAASEELGHNLTEVQNLLHKHQVNGNALLHVWIQHYTDYPMSVHVCMHRQMYYTYLITAHTHVCYIYICIHVYVSTSTVCDQILAKESSTQEMKRYAFYDAWVYSNRPDVP